MLTPVTTNPFESAPPIFRWDPAHPDRSQGHCGSSFLLSGEFDGTLLVTAAHVVLDGGIGEQNTSAVAVSQPETDVLAMEPILRWHVDDRADLAVGVIENRYGAEGFEIHEGPLPRNFDVASVEHSRSVEKDRSTAGRSTVSPLLQKGYIVHSGTNLHPQFPDVYMLELSFPALKGASGAPIFLESNCAVVGVTVANVERELLPAQVLRSLDDDGRAIEEVRYFLPNGLAVRYSALLEVVGEAREKLS